MENIQKRVSGSFEREGGGLTGALVLSKSSCNTPTQSLTMGTNYIAVVAVPQ